MQISRAQKFFNAYARYVQKPSLALVRPHWLLNRMADLTGRMMAKRAPGYQRQDETLAFENNQVGCSWVDLGGDTSRGVLLYLHGGAFVIGTIGMYAHMVSRLADAAQMSACFVHYRLAPKYPFPAASDDALTAYRALLDRGIDPARIAVVGDSAGGNLAFSLLHRLGQQGLPMPGAVAAMSPVVDMTGSSPSIQTNRKTELLLAYGWGQRAQRDYLNGADVRDPLASPIFGGFRGAPPVLIQVAASEMFRDDSRRMADVLRGDGVQVRLDEWEGVFHVWHLNAGRSPEADKGVADIAAFLRDVIAEPAAQG